MNSTRLFFSFLLCFLLCTAARASEYTYSDDGSRVGFTLKHLNIITVEGVFKDFAGHFEFDAESIEDSSVELVIRTESLDSANSIRDSQLKSRDYFWISKYPEITFTSTAFGNIRGNRFEVYGDLTIRGKTVTAVFETRILTPLHEIVSGKPIRFSAETYIHRKDFGLGTGRWYDPITYITGETLKIDLEVEGFQLPSVMAEASTSGTLSFSSAADL